MDNSQEALNERIRIVAEAWLGGASKTEAYRQAGYASPTPANASAFFDTHREEIDKHIYRGMKNSIPIAINTLTEIMLKGESEGARVKAATEILDRAGFDKIERIEITTTEVAELENRQISDEINSLLAKAGKLKLVGGTDAKKDSGSDNSGSVPVGMSSPSNSGNS